MPTYVFRCTNDGCLVNLSPGDSRVARASKVFGREAVPGGELLDEVDVAYPSYAAMKVDEAAGRPACSICSSSMVRKPTAAKFGTTRSTTPAKKQLDCAIGESSERQWKMIQRDRDARGSDFLRGERLSNFAKEDAEAKKQAAEVFGYKGSGAQRN